MKFVTEQHVNQWTRDTTFLILEYISNSEKERRESTFTLKLMALTVEPYVNSFPKFELLNLGYGLSVTVAHKTVFMVHSGVGSEHKNDPNSVLKIFSSFLCLLLRAFHNETLHCSTFCFATEQSPYSSEAENGCTKTKKCFYFFGRNLHKSVFSFCYRCMPRLPGQFF